MAYRDFIEYLDDLVGEFYDCRNVELSGYTDETERSYLIWEGQKASQFFEDAVDLTQVGLARDAINVATSRGGWLRQSSKTSTRTQ